MPTSTIMKGAQVGASLINSASQSDSGNWSRGGSYTDQSRAEAFRREQRASAQAFSRAEAQKNRDWQKMMSDTAYQRAMADMKKAGLNPILAYSQGGRSTPGGDRGEGYMGGIGAEGGSSSESQGWSHSRRGAAYIFEKGADLWDALNNKDDKNKVKAAVQGYFDHNGMFVTTG